MSESAIRTYAASKRIGDPTLERWLSQRSGDRDAVLALVERLRLGENQVRDLIDRLEDVAARRGSSPGAVLADPAVRAVLERGLGRNQTIHALRLALNRLRYPQMAVVEEELRRLVGGLRLPSGVRVELPADLEGDSVAVVVSAPTASELRARLQSLAGAVAGEEVDRIYALLEGKW
jgi:hypothetical protein